MQDNKITRVKILEKIDTPDNVDKLFDSWTDKMGKVPEWARVMAHCPDILLSFSNLLRKTMCEGSVSAEVKWKMAFHVSRVNECEYCTSVAHNKLHACGLDDEIVERIKNHKFEDLPKAEQIVLEYGEAVTREAYKISDDLFNKLKNHYNDQQIVELTSVIGLFNYINRFNDALRVIPE
ncbi:MAG: hypothetical protein HOA57_05050 [Candidatus Magasanikbacteria bacterium]|jgi:uncharacterized peroxidase-related enzyme|nr:hypothetical protein [Candidatus Magasanikbacteria bacterium]MBT4315285.1 hypothetical protein [Candidatus Magasanikbacteria bacterium]MBT4547157.1 hypothetical protein [Candidatus Magasanikbacteria bacterium]MBT6819711.1 hypothetical protein [Candidatus Magasanikbacteria bacterium]